MDKNENHQKTSAMVVLLFVIAILSCFGFIFIGVSYDSWLSDGINVIVSVLVIYWAYYARNRLARKNLSGFKMATFTLYALSAILVLEIIAALLLLGSSNSLKKFAETETPNFFANNLEWLKNNSTDELQKVLVYEATVNDINKKFTDIGTIKNCVQEKNDDTSVMYGPTMNTASIEVGLTGSYSVRCFGEKKPFDLFVDVKNKNGKWLVDSYQFDVKLEDGFDRNPSDSYEDSE